MVKSVAVPAIVWHVVRLAVAAALVVFGTQASYHALLERRPVTMSYTEFARTQPASGWFIITGGRLDFAHAARTKPLRLAGRTTMIVPIVDEEAPLLPTVLLAETDVSVTGDPRIEGIIEGTFAEPSGVQPAIDQLGKRIAPNYRIIGLDEKPDLALHIALSVFGYLVALVLLAPTALAWMDRRTPAKPDPRQRVRRPSKPESEA